MINPRSKRKLKIYLQSLSWALLFGFVPSIAFLTYSYRQAIASNQNRLATVVEEAALKVDRLFETADSLLTRLAADIDDPSNPEALSMLRRIVYNDPRFREAGIINEQGQLVSTSLGLVEAPIQISPQNPSDSTIEKKSQSQKSHAIRPCVVSENAQSESNKKGTFRDPSVN